MAERLLPILDHQGNVIGTKKEDLGPMYATPQRIIAGDGYVPAGQAPLDKIPLRQPLNQKPKK